MFLVFGFLDFEGRFIISREVDQNREKNEFSGKNGILLAFPSVTLSLRFFSGAIMNYDA